MKPIVFILIIALNCTLAFGQTMFDALKSNENQIVGTARYSSMAGAFGALGGDASAIKDNPAGLGIYRKSEITYTIDALMQSNNSNWNGQSSNDNNYRIGSNNLTLVLALPTWKNEVGYRGLLSSNISFSYNKLKNFNRNINIKSKATGSSMTDYFGDFTGNADPDQLEWDNYPQMGYSSAFDNIGLSWMSVMADSGRLINPYIDSQTGKQRWGSFLTQGENVTPSYSSIETGSTDEYSFGWSGNFSNRIFIGSTLNLQSLNYRIESKYAESFEKGGQMTLDNSVITKGKGINLNLGAIIVPFDFLRIGMALHTPMFFDIRTTNYATLSFNSSVDGNLETPINNKDYVVQSPLQFNLSAAYIFNKSGLFSIEYVQNNYKGMKLMDTNLNSQEYKFDNTDINTMLNNSHTIKLGAEYKLNDNFAVRAGFASTSPITKNNAVKFMVNNTVRTDPEYLKHNKTDYLTFGLGYREASWYVDLAYVNMFMDEDYYAFNSTNKPAKVETTNNNIILTLGLRF